MWVKYLVFIFCFLPPPSLHSAEDLMAAHIHYVLALPLSYTPCLFLKNKPSLASSLDAKPMLNPHCGNNAIMNLD